VTPVIDIKGVREAEEQHEQRLGGPMPLVQLWDQTWFGKVQQLWG
jgi:hypothetical protein